MSKWSLLLKGGSRDANVSTCSIHRFTGFEDIVPCQRTIWIAFRLHLYSDQLHTVHSVVCLSQLIDRYLEHTADCTECLVTCAYGQIEHDDETTEQQQAEDFNDCSMSQTPDQIHRLEAILREGAAMGLYRINSLLTTNSTLTAEFFALSSSSSFAPTMKVCEYRVYRIPLLSVPLSPPIEPPTDLALVPELVANTSIDGVDVDGGIRTGVSNPGPNPGPNPGSNPCNTNPGSKPLSRGPIVGGSFTHHSIYTREKPSTVKVTKAGLLSHQLFGVDNTGANPSSLFPALPLSLPPPPPLSFLPLTSRQSFNI